VLLLLLLLDDALWLLLCLQYRAHRILGSLSNE
jgi:hypothetical protein